MDKIKWYVIGFLAVLGVFVTVYLFGKKSGGFINLDNVEGTIPSGWSAVPSAEALYAAMDGIGTDTDAIWNTLEPINNPQRAAVYNEYLNRFGVKLFDDFKSDLSGDDLRRALNYFTFMA